MIIAIAGGIVTLTSATLLYLASPNQPHRLRAARSGTLRRAGSVGMVLGLLLILQWAGPATSAFIALTLAMVIWTLVPLAAAVWRETPENRK